MSNAYPIETVIRAHALFMDYISFRDIERILRQFEESGPTFLTVHKWAKAGEGTGGIAWDRWREISESKRAVASVEKKLKRIKPAGYEEAVDQSLLNLDLAEEKIMEAVEFDTLQPKLSDLKDIIKIRNLLHGRATQRIEMETSLTRQVAQILGDRGRQIITDQNELAQLLDLVAQDFERAYAAPKALLEEPVDAEYEIQDSDMDDLND